MKQNNYWFYRKPLKTINKSECKKVSQAPSCAGQRVLTAALPSAMFSFLSQCSLYHTHTITRTPAHTFTWWNAQSHVNTQLMHTKIVACKFLVPDCFLFYPLCVYLCYYTVKVYLLWECLSQWRRQIGGNTSLHRATMENKSLPLKCAAPQTLSAVLTW